MFMACKSWSCLLSQQRLLHSGCPYWLVVHVCWWHTPRLDLLENCCWDQEQQSSILSASLNPTFPGFSGHLSHSNSHGILHCTKLTISGNDEREVFTEITNCHYRCYLVSRKPSESQQVSKEHSRTLQVHLFLSKTWSLESQRSNGKLTGWIKEPPIPFPKNDHVNLGKTNGDWWTNKKHHLYIYISASWFHPTPDVPVTCLLHQWVER